MTDPIIEHKEQEVARRARGLLNILTRTTTSGSISQEDLNMEKAVKMYKHICKQRPFTWFSKTEKPVKCPNCQSRIWDKVRKPDAKHA